MQRIIKYYVVIFFGILQFSISNEIQYSPNIKLPVSTISNLDIVDNPSKSYFIERNSVALSYKPSSFGLPELNVNNISSNFRTDSIAHLLNLNGTFDRKYTAANFSYTLCYALFDKLIPSVTINYNYLSIQNYNSYNKVSIDLGGFIRLNSGLNFGFSITNLNNSKFEESNKIVRQIALFGMEYYLSEDFILNIGTEIRIENSFGIALGFIKYFAELGTFGVSYLTEPEMVEINAKIIALSNLNIIYDLNYHNQIGATHQFGISYDFD